MDMGPGLQAAMRTYGDALEKVSIMHIRSPCMYSLAQPALVGSPVPNNAKLEAEIILNSMTCSPCSRVSASAIWRQ